MNASGNYLKTSDRVITKPTEDGSGWRWVRLRSNSMPTGRQSSKDLTNSETALADAKAQNPDVTKFEQQNDW